MLQKFVGIKSDFQVLDRISNSQTVSDRIPNQHISNEILRMILLFILNRAGFAQGIQFVKVWSWIEC